MERENSHNKLPSELSIEELLEQALSEESSPVKEPPNSVVHFLLFYKIEPGNFPVNKKLLYRLYKKSTKEAFSNRHFFLECSNYLSKEKDFYLINQNAFEIGQKTFAILKEKQSKKNAFYVRHFQNFLKASGIKSGTRYVSLSQLHNEYRSWAYSVGRKKPLKLAIFTKYIKLHLSNIKIVKGIMHVGIRKRKHEKEKTAKETQK